MTRVRTHDEEQLHCDNLGINAVTISSNETVRYCDANLVRIFLLPQEMNIYFFIHMPLEHLILNEQINLNTHNVGPKKLSVLRIGKS